MLLSQRAVQLSTPSRIALWFGGGGHGDYSGNEIYAFDVDTNVWTKVAADPANTVRATASANTGTFGRWQYLSSEDVFMLYNNVDENVFFYRLPSDGVPGDFDEDGDIDGSDFLTWQRDPVAHDLSDWLSGYDSGAIVTSSSVPEPGSMALLLTAMLLMARRRC